jgi:hypothetical protein
MPPTRSTRWSPPVPPQREVSPRRAQQLLGRHPHFRGRAHLFQFECTDRAVVVRGRVPSYYLKQLVQSALQELGTEIRIINSVEVIGYGQSSHKH